MQPIILKNPPIKEIIFTVSFNETLNVDVLGKFKNIPKISSKFKKERPRFHANITERKGKNPHADVLNEGYLLSDEPGTSLLQVLRGSFAFHKVKEYEEFDVLVKQLQDYWIDFLKSIDNKPLTISEVSVRYLNFIRKDIDESTNDLLNIKTETPFSHPVKGFVNISFPYASIPPSDVNITIADGFIEGDGDGVILDINVRMPISDGKNITKTFQYISEIRNIKNEIFFNCITSKTLIKYNQ